MLSGLCAKDNIAKLCRTEGIAQSHCYSWSKEFHAVGTKRLAGDTDRQANIGKVKALRAEAMALNGLVADLGPENGLLKTMAGAGSGQNCGIPPLRKRDYLVGGTITSVGLAHSCQDRHSAHHILPPPVGE